MSLLSLEELLRKILLLPQSAQIKKFTVEKIFLKKFPIAECVQGLVAAEDLNLDTSNEIFQFITDNLGTLLILKSKDEIATILSTDSPSLTERFNCVVRYINDQVVRANILPNFC